MGELASIEQLRAGVIRWAIVLVPLIVLLGFVSGQVSNSSDGNPWYAALTKPAFQPPAIAFPVVWTILYVMIALALSLIVVARGNRLRGRAVTLFVVQLVLNLAWSPVFFGLHRSHAGLVLIVVILGVAVATTVVFARIRRTAALLMLPYLGWLGFAAVLNAEIVRLNPEADGLVVGRAVTRIELK